MDIDGIVEASQPRNPRKGCSVCKLTGDAGIVVSRLEDIILEHGRGAVSAAAVAEDPEWQVETGIKVWTLTDHFRKCLPREDS